MIALFSLLLLLPACLASDCYFRDGSQAVNDDGSPSYVQCPGVDWCCKPTDTCTTNGLCRDINNHQDGSNVTLGDASVNMTGLYQTPACVNSDFDGCVTQCSDTSSNFALYLWACNNQLSEYCCSGGYPLTEQKACCADNANFELGVASTSSSSSTSSTSSTSSASSTSSSTSSIASATTSSSTLATTTAAPATAAASNPTSSATSSSSPSSSSSSLSQGAKIGIGVGVSVGVVVLAILAALFWRIQKIQKRLKPAASPSLYHDEASPAAEAPAYHQAEEVKVPYTVAEMAQPPAEVDGRERPVELDGEEREKARPFYR